MADKDTDDSSFHRKESLAPTNAYSYLGLMKGLMNYNMSASMILKTLLFRSQIIRFDKLEKRMRIFETAQDHMPTLDTYSDVIASCKRK